MFLYGYETVKKCKKFYFRAFVPLARDTVHQNTKKLAQNTKEFFWLQFFVILSKIVLSYTFTACRSVTKCNKLSFYVYNV